MSTEGEGGFRPAVMTEAEVAVYTGLSRSFLRQSRMQHGDYTPGPPFMKIGRAVRYLVVDVDRWLSMQRHQCLSK